MFILFLVIMFLLHAALSSFVLPEEFQRKMQIENGSVKKYL